MEKQYKKLSIDFPADEYTYLKMACAKQGISIKDFVTNAVVQRIEDYEDELTAKKLEQEESYNKASKKVLKKYDSMFRRLSKK